MQKQPVRTVTSNERLALLVCKRMERAYRVLGPCPELICFYLALYLAPERQLQVKMALTLIAMPTSTARRALEICEHKGLLTRHANAADRRSVFIRATPPLIELVDRLIGIEFRALSGEFTEMRDLLGINGNLAAAAD